MIDFLTTIFLYCDDGTYDTAYFITPDLKSETLIEHQYGCVGCSHITIRGSLEIIPQELAKIFEDLLGCHYAAPEIISMKTGLHVIQVLGEGLCLLEDGRYVATENCD